jgi:hypothetical protein
VAHRYNAASMPYENLLFLLNSFGVRGLVSSAYLAGNPGKNPPWYGLS